MIPDENKKFEHFYLNDINDIFSYKNELNAALNQYLSDKQNKAPVVAYKDFT